ncbi:Arm DNA-binding domain-containing protein [Microseira wollei]|uniref:Integrase n=1 Tax=Microseira wollei NIES-4236 TaxID=2530354 RepID=A0AAV3XPM5_9CYAN|nr:putative integrase [Microseira wollei NIES-4236]
MKAPKGTVGIETHHGWLRLRLPRTVTTGSSRYFSLGLQDTPDNRKKAQVIAWDIETDIQGGLLRAMRQLPSQAPSLTRSPQPN